MLKGETKKSVKQLTWDQDQDIAFKNLKDAVVGITYRAQPDFKKEFIVTTDASYEAIGAILAQVTDNYREEIIYTYSKKLEKAQKNYSVTEKELLAVVKSLEHLRHYLIGQPFTLKTDHKALEYLWKTSNTMAGY